MGSVTEYRDQEVNGESEDAGPGSRTPHPGLADTVVAMAADLDLADVLGRIVTSAAELTGAQYSALGVLEAGAATQPRRPLAEFHYHGISEQQRAEIGALPAGLGVLGVLIKDPRPLRLPDITQHPASVGFPPHHPPMRSFLGVPVRVRGVVFGNLYLCQKHSAAEFSAEDERTVVSLAAAAGVAIENARSLDDANRRARWLTAAAEITRQIAPGRRESAQLIADAVRQAGSCDDVLVALPVHAGGHAADGDGADDAGALTYDAELEDADLPITGASGARAEPFRGRTLGSLAEVVDRLDAAPASVLDFDPFGPDRADRRAVVLQLQASERRLGIMVLSRPRSLGWSAGELLAAGAFANQLSLTMAQVKAERDRRRLAVYADRDRIARDLHDSVIQRIYAVGLGLNSVVRRLEDATLAHRMNRYINDLDATIAEIRTTIFSLHHEADIDLSGHRDGVLAVVADVSAALGFDPQVILAGPIDSAIPVYLNDDVLAVVRESLTNVARHAEATEATVLVEVDSASKTLRVQVDDDGVGIPGTVIPGHGLRNTKARAVAAGGHAGISRRAQGGSTFTWVVPLPL